MGFIKIQLILALAFLGNSISLQERLENRVTSYVVIDQSNRSEGNIAQFDLYIDGQLEANEEIEVSFFYDPLFYQLLQLQLLAGEWSDLSLEVHIQNQVPGQFVFRIKNLGGSRNGKYRIGGGLMIILGDLT